MTTHTILASFLVVIADASSPQETIQRDKKESLRRLRRYLVERWEMVDYPQALARGWDIGSS